VNCGSFDGRWRRHKPARFEAHAIDHRDLVAVLQIPAHALQRNAHANAGRSTPPRTDTRAVSNCGELKAHAGSRAKQGTEAISPGCRWAVRARDTGRSPRRYSTPSARCSHRRGLRVASASAGGRGPESAGPLRVAVVNRMSFKAWQAYPAPPSVRTTRNSPSGNRAALESIARTARYSLCSAALLPPESCPESVLYVAARPLQRILSFVL